ncbi:Interference hedgehog [Gryllus bimaculatus]|nr:Interference hedgehog [Gryllus bimaculatus]
MKPHHRDAAQEERGAAGARTRQRPEARTREGFRVAAVYVNNDNKPGPISDKFMLARGEVGNDLAVPTLKDATALSPTALHIRWEYTASSHTPAQGFYVHYRPASTAGDYLQVTVEGESEREFTLSHLEPNTAYEVKVQSFNLDSASNFSNIRAQKTLPAPTEEPPSTETDEAASGQANAAKGQLFTVLWPVLGGLAVLGLILGGIFLCRRRRLQAGESEHYSS